MTKLSLIQESAIQPLSLFQFPDMAGGIEVNFPLTDQ